MSLPKPTRARSPEGAPGRAGKLLPGALVGVVLTVATAHAGSLPALGVPGASGGVVTASEPHAARAGAEILRAGGNAIDAAAAVAFALNVVEPQSAGIGGGGFMLLYLAGPDLTVTVDSRETAPAAATADMFVPFAGPGGFSVASTSGLSVGVPGMLRGIELALDRWGSKSLDQVLAPAIQLAENGFRVGPYLADSVTSPRLRNEPGDPAYEAARAVFLPDGTPVPEGELLVQPDLADTLKLLAARGADAFYSGPVAAAIVAAQRARRAAAGSAGSGRMTLDDLARYEAVVREPLVGEYRGYTFKGMGPPSSGPLTLIHALKLMERFPIGDRAAGFGFGTTRTLNAFIESMRLAFADRALWMGDADFVAVPVEGLLSDAYVRRRSALIDPDKRRDRALADDPRPFAAAFAGGKVKPAVPRPARAGGLNTTHFSVIDRDGNIVSYTNTIESAWGTGLMVPGFGFLLNNELTDFNFEPTANPDPDNFDPGANDVAGNKRPRSSMSPVIVFDGSQPLAAFGSPGGSTIISTVAQVAMNLIDHRFDVQEAVDAPRIAQTSADGSAAREIGFSETVMAALQRLGHALRFPGDIGSVQAVIVDGHGQRQYGAADRRRVGGIVSLRRDEITRRGPPTSPVQGVGGPP